MLEAAGDLDPDRLEQEIAKAEGAPKRSLDDLLAEEEAEARLADLIADADAGRRDRTNTARCSGFVLVVLLGTAPTSRAASCRTTRSSSAAAARR